MKDIRTLSIGESVKKKGNIITKIDDNKYSFIISNGFFFIPLYNFTINEAGKMIRL